MKLEKKHLDRNKLITKTIHVHRKGKIFDREQWVKRPRRTENK